MKTILVPTDYSPGARTALLYAIEVAREADARIVLLHAFFEPLSFPYMGSYTAVINDLERRRTKKLEAYAKEVKSLLLKDFAVQFRSILPPDVAVNRIPHTQSGFHTVEIDETPLKRAEVNIKCICKFGIAFDEILKAVEVHEADLVVMGMRGENAFTRALLGRTTIRVMQEASVPVLAVPLDARFEEYKSVVFAADLFKLPSRAVLGLLGEFVSLFHSRLQVLHLYRKNSPEREMDKALAALNTLDQQLRGVDYRVVFQQREDVAAGVQDFVQEQRAGLLVLLPQKHTFLEKLLNRSLTHQLLTRTFVPILALPSCVRENTRDVEDRAERSIPV
ncbi:universal stress protein [Pontibacter chitinilyticus]|uniref:universal stress protein n=1 Tax=Pontibacter chitinilyticus TaxID=2674989 RepID=UPI00321B5E1E